MYIHNKILFYDPEYNQLSERPGELLKQIKEKLNTEDQELLWELSRLTGRMRSSTPRR